ncbi:unnamed protein product [Cochlearia groenlandica]
MTHVLVLKERQVLMKPRRHHMMMIMCFLFLFFFVIIQISLSSSLSSDLGRFVSPSRKTMVYATTTFHRPLSKEEEEEEDDNIYGEDKRVVHTGPNPLHN